MFLTGLVHSCIRNSKEYCGVTETLEDGVGKKQGIISSPPVTMPLLFPLLLYQINSYIRLCLPTGPEKLS